MTNKPNRKRRRFWDYAVEYPPVVCRLMARKGRPPIALSDEEISAGSKTKQVPSGLEVDVVERISECPDWHGVPLHWAEAFLRGCRMDWANGKDMHRARDFIAHGGFRNLEHLRRSHVWNLQKTQRLLEILRRLSRS